MQVKFRVSEIKVSAIIHIVIFLSIGINNSHLSAQSTNSLDDTKYKDSILQKVDSLLIKKYVLAEKAEAYSDEFKKMIESGQYDSFRDPNEFAKKVTADLVKITDDKHFSFRLIKPSETGEKTEGSLRHPIRYHILGINENMGFTKLEWIEGNIGYLDIRRFYTFADVKDMIIGAIKFLSRANAIIIDLRENGGGSGDYLSSYFLEYPTQLTGWYSREDNFLTEFWTTEDIGVEPLTDVPLFLITSRRTFSASESFAYDMKVRTRAVIVGDSTKGGAHSVDLYNINDQFEIYIPTVRAINPISGTNWEGTGVIPDIIVPKENALDTTIVLARKAGLEYAKGKETRFKLAVKKVQIQIDSAEKLFQEKKSEDAEKALDLFFKIAEDHDLVNEFFIDVLAYNYRSPKDEDILYAILKKKIALYPESPSAYESIAYAYYNNGKKELAITYFESVIQLEPNNRNAKNMIKRIREK
jgi:hypothetical protein